MARDFRHPSSPTRIRFDQSSRTEEVPSAGGASKEFLHRYHEQIRQLAERPLPYPDHRFHGRGIVTAAGGRALFSCAYVLVHRLRQMGCALPVEVWYRGPAELSPYMRSLLEEVGGVRCVDAYAFQRAHPGTWTDEPLGGFELKAYAMLHSRFREAMFIDADNVPTRDPSYLFDDEAYRDTGAIFWPDRYLGHGRGERYRSLYAEAWEAADLAPRDETEFETGQMLLDKQRSWRAMHLALFFNQHAGYFYRWMHGDKDTFHLAWRRLGQAYVMPPRPVRQPAGHGPALYQHDMQGQRIFQHRVHDKWDVVGENQVLQSYVGEAQCHGLLDELRHRWDGIVRRFPWDYSPVERAAFGELMDQPLRIFATGDEPGAEPEAAIPICRAGAGNDCDGIGEARPLGLRPDFHVGRGAAPAIAAWNLEPTHQGEPVLTLGDGARKTATLRHAPEGAAWTGRQVLNDHLPVALAPAGQGGQ